VCCTDRPTRALRALAVNRLGKRELHRTLSFLSSSGLYRCRGAGCLWPDCTEQRGAARSGCRCLSSRLQHRPGDTCASSRHLQFTSSSSSLWPEDFCLGSRPDLLFKQRAEAALREEVLHISDRFRDVCSRQGLVC